MTNLELRRPSPSDSLEHLFSRQRPLRFLSFSNGFNRLNRPDGSFSIAEGYNPLTLRWV